MLRPRSIFIFLAVSAMVGVSLSGKIGEATDINSTTNLRMSQKDLYEQIETELNKIDDSIDKLAESLDFNTTVSPPQTDSATYPPSQTDSHSSPSPQTDNTSTPPPQTDPPTKTTVEGDAITDTPVETDLPSEEPTIEEEESEVYKPEENEKQESENVIDERINENIENVQKRDEEKIRRLKYLYRYGRLPYETGSVIRHKTRILLSTKEDIVNMIINPILNVKAFKNLKEDSETKQSICYLDEQSDITEKEFCNTLNGALVRIGKNTDVVNQKEATETTLNELQSDRKTIDKSTTEITENDEIKQLINTENLSNEVDSVKEGIEKAQEAVTEKRDDIKSDEALTITLSVIFSILGVAIIAFGVIYYRKKKQN